MRRGWRALTLILPLAGCADLQSFDPPVAGEMRPGPGLFSGPDGVFVLSREAFETPPAADDENAGDRRDLTLPPPE
jgi:hypothetical protein